MMIRKLAASVAGLIVLALSALAAQQSVSRGNNLSADVARDGRVAIDLAGDIWIVPAGGGEASPVTPNLRSVQRPRWSPDASAIAYQALHQSSQAIWVYEFASGESRRISRGASFAIHPSWHPDGERIVYASDPAGEGLDLWETDLPTGLHWRLSDRPGDETDAAWSSDGRDLVYVHHQDDEWSLILRKHGLPEETLITSNERLAGPSFRPDGTLITYVRKSAAGTTIDMVILSQPRLIRPYAADEEYGLAPLSWLDRHRIVYTAGGMIRQRLFNSWTSSTLPFQATLGPQRPAPGARKLKRRPLPRIAEPEGQLVIHTARLFDGLGDRYRLQHDIVIDGGRIKTVEPHKDRSGSIIVDMGDLVVLPGYIDARANLGSAIDDYGDRLGPLLLSTGVTTIVAESPDTERLNTEWSGKSLPGPRLLDIAEWPQPDVRAVADSNTPGLQQLLQSRQNNPLAQRTPVVRRFSEPLDLTAVASSVVLGSFENRLSPGIAVQAEFLALKAAGLTPEQTLKAAGVNAAAALQVDPLLGRIAVGASADLVFVDGDPLSRIEDALKVVAVVRNGRFFSVGGLIDRLQTAESVEEIDKTDSD